MSPNLRMQKRLACSILGCGKARAYLDPMAQEEIAGACTRRAIRKLISNRVIVKKPIIGNSRYRFRVYQDAKRRGRHAGPGCRFGSRNARNPFKTAWMMRMRCQRRILRLHREEGKVDRAMYRMYYMRVKGNQFKSKRSLLEHLIEAEKIHEQNLALAAQREALRKAGRAKKETPAE